MNTYGILISQEREAGDVVWSRNGAGGTDRTDDHYTQYTLLVDIEDRLFKAVFYGPTNYSLEPADLSDPFIANAVPSGDCWIVNWDDWGYAALRDFSKSTFASSMIMNVTRHFGREFTPLCKENQVKQIAEAEARAQTIRPWNQRMNRLPTMGEVIAYAHGRKDIGRVTAQIRIRLTNYNNLEVNWHCEQAQAVLISRANRVARAMLAAATCEDRFAEFMTSFEKDYSPKSS